MAMTAHERRRFRERAGTYLLGVAIGCMLASVLLLSRWMVVKRERALEAQRQGGAPATPAR
jgi:hypothetical protein